MNKPQPKPVDPSEVLELATAVVQADRFPYLATIDGDQPRLRPVSPVKTDGFTIYVANLRSYHKTVEIEANPRVELCYLNSNHDQVRITGTARSGDGKGRPAGNLGRKSTPTAIPREHRKSRVDSLPHLPHPGSLHARVGVGILRRAVPARAKLQRTGVTQPGRLRVEYNDRQRERSEQSPYGASE